MNELKKKAADNWRPTTLIVGAVVGTLIGLSAAYILVQTAERENRKPELTPGDTVRLGLVVLGLLRSVAALGEEG